jgi:uncharacterized protein involved in exopolysaccharide biosynthesis
MRPRHMPRPSEPQDPGRPAPSRSLFEAQTEDPIDQLRHWLGMVRRQWFLMLLVWILVMAGAVALLRWWPRQYQSTAKFLVRNARQDLVVNPSSGSASVRMDDVSEETLNSEIELLKSRDLLERVVRELRLDTPEKAGEDESLALERAVRKLSGALEIGSIRKTNFIRVAYLDRDPKQAAAVLRHLADTYMSVHLSVHSSPGTYEFFKEQTAVSKAKWEEAQQELTALARRADLLAPDEQRRAAMQAANDMEAQLAVLEAQIGEQASRATSTEMQLGAIDSRIVTQERKMPNQPSVERLHTLITELKNKRTQLLTKFKASDRLVLEIDDQLANTEAALKEASALKSTEEATDLNPSWQALKTEEVNTRLSLAGLTSKAARLKKQLAEYRSRAITLTEAAPQYEALVRRVSEARTEHELYTKRAEEARVAEALDKQKISNVVLTDAPVASHFPAKPRVKVGLVVGGMMATLLAGAVGLVAEWFRAGAAARRSRRASYASVTGRVIDASEA